MGGTLSLTRASSRELELLPGIGPTRAKAIVAYRREKGLSGIDDLINVRGIGPKTLERIRPFVHLDPPTTQPIEPP